MSPELSPGTVGLVSSPSEPDVGVSTSSGPSFAESTDEFPVGVVVTDDSPGLVADGSEPTVDTGELPEVVAPEGLPVDPDSVPVVDEEFVNPGEEFVDSGDEFVDSDELDDDGFESSVVADAAPMPPVQTSPATPSEKATAPTRNAYLRNASFDEST
jgi:hypothetical protein